MPQLTKEKHIDIDNGRDWTQAFEYTDIGPSCSGISGVWLHAACRFPYMHGQDTAIRASTRYCVHNSGEWVGILVPRKLSEAPQVVTPIPADINRRMLDQVVRFVVLNRKVLRDHWFGTIDSVDLFERIKPLGAVSEEDRWTSFEVWSLSTRQTGISKVIWLQRLTHGTKPEVPVLKISASATSARFEIELSNPQRLRGSLPPEITNEDIDDITAWAKLNAQVIRDYWNAKITGAEIDDLVKRIESAKAAYVETDPIWEIFYFPPSETGVPKVIYCGPEPGSDVPSIKVFTSKTDVTAKFALVSIGPAPKLLNQLPRGLSKDTLNKAIEWIKLNEELLTDYFWNQTTSWCVQDFQKKLGGVGDE